MKNNTDKKEYITPAQDGFWMLIKHAFGRHAGLAVRIAICAALAAVIAPFFIPLDTPEPNAQEQTAP